MYFEIVSSFLIILLIYLIRTWYIRPIRAMRTYAKQLEAQGYRVLLKPYSPFYSYFQQIIQRPQKEGDSLRSFRQFYPRYDAIVTNIINQPYIQLCHPDLIKDFYSYDKHYEYPKLKIGIEFITRITGNGLPFSEGKSWKQKRNLINKVFNFDFLKFQSLSIARTCQQVFSEVEIAKKIQEKAEEGKKRVECNLLDVFVQVFSRVMLASFLGMRGQENIDGVSVASFLKKLIDDSAEQAYDFLGLTFGEKIWKLGLRRNDRSINRRIILYKDWALPYIRNKISETCKKIAENKQKFEANDIIEAIMLEKLKEESQQNLNLESQIFDEFSTFFFAGTDTTSNFTQMMICYIAQHPQVQAKLREQIAQYMQHDDYSYENLKNFQYLDNIQKQTTRMYGPGIYLFIREAASDNLINGLPIKKGTLVMPVHHGNHYSDKYFKDPLTFNPERWEVECSDIPAFVLGGFSAGARTCIGKHLALLENKIAVIMFMKRYTSIEIPKDIKMDYKFLPCPETFNTKLTVCREVIQMKK